MLTPIKKRMGQKELERWAKLYSTTVSKIRQPIESFLVGYKKKQTYNMPQKYVLPKDLMFMFLEDLLLLVFCWLSHFSTLDSHK